MNTISPTPLVSIHTLPLEILHQIFCWSVWEKQCALRDPLPFNPTHSRHNYFEDLVALSHVCKRWRSIIVNSPSFWSHVDLTQGDIKTVDKSCDRLQACLQRTGSLPLCLWASGLNFPAGQSLDVITRCLRPHLNNLEALSLTGFCEPPMILELISCWLTYGKPGSVHSLSVWHDDLPIWCRLYSTNSTLSHQHLESFLEPIRVLRLSGAWFDWNSSVYRNLVSLQLKYVLPRLKEILGVLSASPRLQILQLHSVAIHYDRAEELSLRPVVLPELKILDLMYVSPDCLLPLLLRIVPQSQELTVRVDTPNESDGDEALLATRLFLSRSNVSRLYIHGPNTPDEVVAYLSAVPNLNTLILHFDEEMQPDSDNILTVLMPSPGSSFDLALRCPRLRTLYLIKGAFGEMVIRDAVQAHPFINKLRLMDCELKSPGLLPWLKQSVTDIAYEIESKECLMHWYDYLT